MEVKGTVDGKEVTYVIKKPNQKEITEAKIYSNKVAVNMLAEAEKSKTKVILRSQLDDMKERLGIWNKDKDELLDSIDKGITLKLRKLTNGGKKTRKECLELANEISKLRGQKFELLLESRQLDELTLESTVENSNFDYLVSVCVRDEEGNNVFSSVEDYLEKKNNDLFVSCAAKLASMLYEYDDNMIKNLPENKFLNKLGIIDADLRPVDKNGNFISQDGKRVNKDGRYVDENGDFVDVDGNRVDQDGNLIGNETELVD